MMDENFISGVIEGFYGQPWSRAERLQLFAWMRDGKLNTYLYAPKDDLKLRARWRESYTREELDSLRELIGSAIALGIEFTYALSPGLDITYSLPTDLRAIEARFEKMLGLGVKSFALLFDDIPDRMRPDDARAFQSVAEAQSHVTNHIYFWLRERHAANRFYFCPTPYCGRMAEHGLGGARYLETIGAQLQPKIQIFWTGPEIISEELPVAHIRKIGSLLRRKPVIWDNLHANDYDGRRFFVGPYSGRSRELRDEVAGILINPNCELPLNYVPIRTFADYLNISGIWHPREIYLDALRAWLPQFDNISFDDLVLLCDCFYLPHHDGPEAEQLYNSLTDVVDCASLATAFPILTKATRLREVCARLAEMKNRPLFYALSRRIWELREELDLLEKFITFRASPEHAPKSFHSDFHQPKTYRGGFVPRLQKLLTQNPDGSFSPSPIGK
ncbi:MAG TPA: beta-N-acetylglucosaminidase domain-containing protein [Verrucomicrobiae bacterium]